MDTHTLDCLDFAAIRDLLARYALSSLGRELARAIEPVGRPELVGRWLDQVRELEAASADAGLPPFGGVSDVRDVVRRCGPPLRVSVEEMARVGDTLAGTRAVAAWLSRVPAECGELRHLADRVGDFGTIAERIQRIIDERGHVRSDASPKLSRIRAEIESAAERITSAFDRLIGDPKIRRLLQYPNHTFHGDRMVLPVRTEYRGRLPGIIHRTSDSGATLYVEPSEAVEINNRVSNLRNEEIEEVNRLLWDLAHEVHINSEAILKTLDALAVLDLISAKVRFARDYDLRVPQLFDEPRVEVHEARHPLLIAMQREQEAAGATPQRIVPISYRLGEDFDLLVITGPNTGGKTVTLKTIGLLTLMLQAGVPVPVGDGSRMCVFKNVLIDIGDEQSMQQSLSTFSAHLRRQMDMLRKAGSRTLVLIDELGAGTDPDEGAAIGRAILDELLKQGCRCVATTHIGALKSYPLTRDRAENASVEFDVETLRPTYHLRIGEPGNSNAIAIAQKLGMPRRLVVSAEKNLSRSAKDLRAALEGTVSAKRQAEDARKAADVAKRDADQERSAAAAARTKLESQQSDFQRWVQRIVHLQPGDAVRVRHFDRDGKVVRVRLDQQRAEVDIGAFAIEVPLGDILPPDVPPPPERAVAPRPREGVPGRRERRKGGGAANAEAANAKRAGSGPRRQRGEKGGPRPDDRLRVPSLSDDEVRGLAPKQEVYVKRFHRRGRVVEVHADKGTVIVTVGALEVEVPFNGVAAPERADEVRAQIRAQREAPSSDPSAAGEQPRPAEPTP